MSASTVIDLANTTDYRQSVSIGSGSNTVIGEIVDLIHAHMYTNVYCAGLATTTASTGGSGVIQIQIQTSDSTTSGNFTDPTSGLASFPTTVLSGGNIYFNSGLWASGASSVAAPISGAPLFCSGGISFAAFQRPQRYARLINVSGGFAAPIAAGFVVEKHETGSGAGFSYSPGSGVVSV